MSPVDSAADITRVPGDSASDDRQATAADRRPIDRPDDARPPDSLRQRMDQLPAGHPSSPYDADGTPRQPIPRLSDLDTARDDHEPDSANPESTGTDDNSHRQPGRQGTNTNAALDQRADRQAVDTNPVTDRRADQPSATERRPPIDDGDPPAEWSADVADSEQPAEAEPSADHQPFPGAEPTADSDQQSADATLPTDQTRPLTDAEWADHVADVRARLGKAQSDGLATDRQYTIGPDRREWSSERNRLQGQLVADLYERARDVPCSGLAVIAGGLGGAGKTTVLGSHAGIDLSKYLTINPDNIKGEMARRGLIPEVEGLSPMEASELVHEEASFVAKRLALRAYADRKNVIWDITMSTRANTERRINDLNTAGYAVDGIFVDIPVETSIRRADTRHREGHDDYRAGIGLGGRYVPPEITEAQAEPDWGSQNRRTFEDVRHRFNHWSLYDNSGRRPLLTATGFADDRNHEEKTS